MKLDYFSCVVREALTEDERFPGWHITFDCYVIDNSSMSRDALGLLIRDKCLKRGDETLLRAYHRLVQELDPCTRNPEADAADTLGLSIHIPANRQFGDFIERSRVLDEAWRTVVLALRAGIPLENPDA